MLKKFVLFILIIFSFSSKAGIADLSVKFEIDATEVDFLQQGNFSVTITNHGPNIAGDNIGGNLPNTVLFTRQILSDERRLDLDLQLTENMEQDCFLGLIVGEPFPGNNNTYFTFIISFPTLPVNESVICYGIYEVGFKEGRRDFSWKTKSYLLDTDSNPTNDIADFSLGIKPQIIPTMSLWALVMLFILLLIIANFKILTNPATICLDNEKL